MESVARCLLHRSDEQRRHLEIADAQSRLAQPARGTYRGAAFDEAQPAADDRALAGIVDADISGIVALERAGGAVDSPFEGHAAIELSVVGRDLDGADIVAARQARIAQPAHVRGEADRQQADAQQQDQPTRNAGHAYARMVVMPPSTTSVWPVM